MIDRSWIGYESEPVELTISRDRLVAFAKAIGEEGKIYRDHTAAQAAGFTDIPAPPTFLFAAEVEGDRIFEVLKMMGVALSQILHAEQGFEYHLPVCAGDHITINSRICDIFTKMGGELQFVEKHSEAYNRAGELVARLRTLMVVRNAMQAGEAKS